MAPDEGVEIEVTLVVKAAPERSQKYGETVCTAALFDDGRLVRIYPVPWEAYRRGGLEKWTRVRVRVTTSDERAARPESHKMVGPFVPVASPLKSGRTTPWDARTKLVERATTPGGMAEVRAIQGETRKSLAVVKVRELLDFRITAPLSEIVDQADYRERPQKSITGEPLMTGSRIDKVKHVFRYRWRCWGSCCEPESAGRRYHDMTCEDWELFESFRSWRGRYADEELLAALKNRYFDELGQTELRFFVGTPSDPKTQNSWMIVGLYYPHRKKYDPARPTLCVRALDARDVLQPDARLNDVEEEEPREAPAARPEKRTLFDY